MKRMSCIFGRHWYKPSEIELYLAEKKPHSNVYRSIARCMYCGKENEQLIEIPHWGVERRMSFKPRYILAEEAEERIVALYRKEKGDAAEIFNTAVDACQNIILDMYDNSSENVVPVVRCRNCKHHDGIRCFRWNSVIVTGFDDFCSEGEKREDE